MAEVLTFLALCAIAALVAVVVLAHPRGKMCYGCGKDLSDAAERKVLGETTEGRCAMKSAIELLIADLEKTRNALLQERPHDARGTLDSAQSHAVSLSRNETLDDARKSAFYEIVHCLYCAKVFLHDFSASRYWMYAGRAYAKIDEALSQARAILER